MKMKKEYRDKNSYALGVTDTMDPFSSASPIEGAACNFTPATCFSDPEKEHLKEEVKFLRDLITKLLV